MASDNRKPVIDGASYYTVNPPHKPLYSGWSQGDIISFYTHDGQLLMSSTDFSDINGSSRLDPQAPKPQVAMATIIKSATGMVFAWVNYPLLVLL